MKKLILGIFIGFVCSLTTSVFATDYLKATLFAVTYEFNGQQKALPNEYVTLNYNGHAYVPVRFVAEGLGSNVAYSQEGGKIIVKSDGLRYHSTGPGMPYGNIIAIKDGMTTKVSVQIESTLDHNDIGGALIFYDEKANEIGSLMIDMQLDSGVANYEGVVNKDVTNYKYVSLTIGKHFGHLYPSPYSPSPNNLNPQMDEKTATRKYFQDNGISKERIDQLGDRMMNVYKISTAQGLSDSQVKQLVDSVLN